MIEETETNFVEEYTKRRGMEDELVCLTKTFEEKGSNKFKELNSLLKYRTKRLEEMVMKAKEREEHIQKVHNCYEPCNDFFKFIRGDDEKWEWIQDHFAEAQIEMCKKLDRDYADYKCPNPPEYEE